MIEKNVLLECENFPCIAWYQNYLNASNVQIEQYENFERTTFRNRLIIAGPNDLITLSIPLKGGRNQKNIMKDLMISYEEKWQVQHWKTIESCYRRSPYFEYYADDIRSLFEKKHSFLIDYNIECLEKINQLIQVKKDIQLTHEFIKNPADTILDLRSSISVDNYSTFQNLPNYIQVFQERNGFKNNLSILDMLFCVGKPLVKELIIAAPSF